MLLSLFVNIFQDFVKTRWDIYIYEMIILFGERNRWFIMRYMTLRSKFVYWYVNELSILDSFRVQVKQDMVGINVDSVTAHVYSF